MTNKERFYEYLNENKIFAVNVDDSSMTELFQEARELEYAIEEQQNRINTIYNVFYYSTLFNHEIINKIANYSIIAIPNLKESTECQLKVVCTFNSIYYRHFDVYVPYDELGKLASIRDKKRRDVVCNKIVEDCLKAVYMYIAEDVYEKISDEFNAKYENASYVTGFLDRFFRIMVSIDNGLGFVQIKQDTEYIINHFKAFGFILSDSTLLTDNDVRISDLANLKFIKEFKENLTKAVCNVLKFFYSDFELEDKNPEK